MLWVALVVAAWGGSGCDRKVPFKPQPHPPEQTLVILNGEPLSLEEFDSEFRLMSIHYGAISGLKMRDAKRLLFDQMVERRLMLQAALREGYSVGRRELDRTLREELEDSPPGFMEQLRSQGISNQAWKTKMAQEILVQKYVEGELYPKAKVSRRAVEDYYWAHLDDFWVPEAIRARHLLVGSKKELDRALACLKKGETFDSVCSRLSADPQRDSGGDWGWIPTTALSKTYVKTLRALSPGEVSKPLKDAFGYHLFQLVEARSTRVRSLKEAAPLARELLLQRERDRLFGERLARLKQEARVRINPELSAVVGIVMEEERVPVQKPRAKKRKR